VGTQRPTLSLELPAVPASVTEARHAVVAYSEDCDAHKGDLGLAVSEAVGNAVMHAYRNAETGRVHLNGEIQGRELIIEVVDEGVGMQPHPGAPGLGMGLALIGSVAREVKLDTSETGLKVEMRFPC
jgi:anti-sigma regulatory factor (Ser/Thr protein kinase)